MQGLNKEKDADLLKRLKRLVRHYSFPERRSAAMLEDIDRLLSWATEKFLRSGLSSNEVKDILGEPFGIIGEETNDSFEFFYPCLPQAAQERMYGEWFYFLKFKDGFLVSRQRRILRN